MKVSFERPDFKRSEGGDKPDYMCAKKNFDRKLKNYILKCFKKSSAKKNRKH